MTTSLGAKPVIDTSEYKERLKDMNADLKVLTSGFLASTASMGDWAATGTGLEARMKSLNAQMDVQRNKVALLRAVYEEMKDAKGEDERATKAAEIEYNKAAETLGKMESELGQTEVALTEMSTATEESGEKAEEASQKHITFGDALKGVGAVAKGVVTAVIGLVAAVGAVGAAIGGLVFSSASAAAELVDLSAKTGISTTALQEMKFIGEQVGVSLDTIATSQARLTRSMASAAEGTGDAAKAFDELGVSVTNSDGSLRDQQEVMADVLSALGGIDNAAERDALAMQIFGRSAMELNPLIGLTADELTAMKDEAHKLGAVMSEEDVAALEAFDDTMGALKLGLQGTLGTLATIFLPGFQMIFGEIGGYVERFAGIVKNFGGTDNLIPGLSGLFTDIVMDIAANAPGMLQAGLAFVTGFLDAIKLSALPELLSEKLGKALEDIDWDDIRSQLTGIDWQQVSDELINGIDSVDWNLIGSVLGESLKTFFAVAQDIADEFDWSGLLGSLWEALESAGEGMSVSWGGSDDWDKMWADLDSQAQISLDAYGPLKTIAKVLVGLFPNEVKPGQFQEDLQAILQNEVDKQQFEIDLKAIVLNEVNLETFKSDLAAIIKNEASSEQFMVDLNVLVSLFANEAKPGQFKESLDELLAPLKNLGSKTADFVKVGKNIVEGIWQGIKGSAGWLSDRIEEWIDELIESLLEAMDAHSPAKRFMPAGKFAVQGFVGGMFEEAKNMERQMGSLLNGVQFSPAFAAAGLASQSVTNSTDNSLTINGVSITRDLRSMTAEDLIDLISRRG